MKRSSRSVIDTAASDLGALIHLVVWITGILVALAVGFGMADSILQIHFLPASITAIAGWIVIAFTILGVILRIIDWLR